MSEKSGDFRKRYKVPNSKNPKKNDNERVKSYKLFVEQQIEQFELYINYINEILIILKDFRIVLDFTIMHARIKAIESALSNDSKKTLDDVFGIEVDFTTSGEKFFVSELIKGTLRKVCKENIHQKNNGYNAHHALGCSVSESVIIDVFEKTINKIINPEEEYKKFYTRLSEEKRERIDKDIEIKEKYMNYFKKFKHDFELYATTIKERNEGKRIEKLKQALEKAEKRYLEKQNEICSKYEDYNHECIPEVEFHLKTVLDAIEADYGSAKHDGVYKSTSELMQEEYDKNKEECLESKTPTVYISYLRRVAGNVIPMEKLPDEEALKSAYKEVITDINEEGQVRV